MTELEQKFKSQCKYIFSVRTEKKITSLDEFLHGERYVISPKSLKEFKRAEYGSGQGKWSNRPISTKVGKIRNAELGLLAKNPPPKQLKKKGEVKPPRLMTITNNTNRGIKAKVVINPNTSQLFEEVLSEMGFMVECGCACALYTTKMPFIRVS